MLTTERIAPFLESDCKVTHNDKLLVAVSGGADSMALLHLLLDLGMSVEAAHVNFRLRGTESDGDEALVTDYCRDRGVKLHATGFDTRQEAFRLKKSIEMTARDLRYQWFDQLLTERGLSAVAVGHHLNDSIETFFINLSRGTGIHGLTGIKPRHGNVIRPLLACTRHEVEAYCREHQIPWRTDSSNHEDDYLRNRIRHHLIPVFEDLNPSFLQTMWQNMGRLGQVESFMVDAIEKTKDVMVAEADGTMLIPIKLLKTHPHKELLLFELLNSKGFGTTQIQDIVNALDGIAGKQFFSPTHRLVRDRDNMVVVPIAETVSDEMGYIENGQTNYDGGIKLVFREIEIYESFELSRSPHCIHVDADRIDYPLGVRKWKQGDSFIPLGMSHFKKLSDLFIDSKLSLLEKERTWLLLSGEDIVWVVGQRIDNRFKVTPKTRRILEVQWIR